VNDGSKNEAGKSMRKRGVVHTLTSYTERRIITTDLSINKKLGAFLRVTGGS
jgi:hypothetical protein